MTLNPYSAPNGDLFTLEEERVIVLGAGRSGLAAANLAADRGATVRLYESQDILPPAGLDSRVELITGATPEMGKTLHSDYLVLSPGIDPQGALAQAFSQQAGECLGELELASRYYTGTMIAITGTNGKTTTTELTAHFLQALGKEALPCGNHGQPLCELLLSGAPEIAVIEVSSFQLETIVTFRPQVAVWMNFAADHLDRYPDLQTYRQAKLRLFEGLLPTDWKVTKQEEKFHFPSHHLTFSASSSTADYTLDGTTLLLPDRNLFDIQNAPLRGRHNLENVMAALAVVQALGLETKSLSKALSTFRPPAHRCEFIGTIDGVEFINDSKSTNLHSLQTALESFSQDLVLIVGGKEKGLDFGPLVRLLPPHVKHVITIGESAESLAALFSSAPHVLSVSSCQRLDHALPRAVERARPGELILFSPGTSSFDQYENYEERGEAFRQIVHRLLSPC